MWQQDLSLGFPIRSDTNWAVQLQKIARGLKFQIYRIELFTIYIAETKALISWSAPLFSHMQKVGFLMTQLIFAAASEYLGRLFEINNVVS